MATKRRESQDLSSEEREVSRPRTIPISLSNKLIQSTDTKDLELFWDQALKYVASSILSLTILEVVFSFARQDSVQCLTPKELTITQSDYISSLCNIFKPPTDFLGLYLAGQATVLIIPHYLWIAFFQSKLTYFKGSIKLLSRQRLGTTGDFPLKNYVVVNSLHKKYTRSHTMFVCYCLKLIIQILITVGAILVNNFVFYEYKPFFYCSRIQNETDSTKLVLVSEKEEFRLPLESSPVVCALPGVKLLKAIWMTDFVLIGVAALLSSVGLVWCFMNHSSDLNWRHSARFAVRSGIDPSLFTPRMLRYRWWKRTFFNYFRYNIYDDFRFLFLKVSQGNSGQAQTLKEVLIFFLMKQMAYKEMEKISLVRKFLDTKRQQGVRVKSLYRELNLVRALDEDIGYTIRGFSLLFFFSTGTDSCFWEFHPSSGNPIRIFVFFLILFRQLYGWEKEPAKLPGVPDSSTKHHDQCIVDCGMHYKQQYSLFLDCYYSLSVPKFLFSDMFPEYCNNNDKFAPRPKKDHFGTWFRDVLSTIMLIEPISPRREELNVSSVDITFGPFKFGNQLILAERSTKVLSINFNPHYDNNQEPVKKETFAFQPEAKVYINSLQMSTNIFASKDHHRQKLLDILNDIYYDEGEDSEAQHSSQREANNPTPSYDNCSTTIVVGPILKKYESGTESVSQLLHIFQQRNYIFTGQHNTKRTKEPEWSTVITILPVEIDGESVKEKFIEYHPLSPWNLKDVVFVHDKRDGKAEDRFPDLKVINQYIERQWTPNDEKKPIKVKCGPLYCKFVIKVYSNKQQ